jgi:S-(hydroxymethyl)glutathione dehydrogenase/alcohol dehydrogenase
VKAAVLESIPGDLQIAEIEIDAPAPREVLIRTKAAGACHSDLHYVRGIYRLDVPFVAGHESAGIVEAVGSDVEYVQPGDHVVTTLPGFCGSCASCLTGHPNLCYAESLGRSPSDPPRLRRDGRPMPQFYNISSFAEMLLLHETQVIKIPKDIPWEVAGILGCAVQTGIGAVRRTAQVPSGATVAVIGCGGIGLNVVQGAALVGASRIIAIDKVESKLELARQFGATDALLADEGIVDRVLELSGGGVEFSFEAIGLKATAEQCLAILRPRGTATIIGMIPEGQSVEVSPWDLLTEKTLKGTDMGSVITRIDIPLYCELYKQGRLKFDELISRRIRLDEINDAYAELETGEPARSVILFD